MNVLEQQIICFILRPDSESQKMALHLLEPNDFEDTESRTIFEIASQRAKAGKVVDLAELMDECNSRGVYKHLVECSDIWVMDTNALSLIESLKAKSIKKFAMSQCQKIYNEIKSKELDTVEDIAQRMSIVSQSIWARNPNYKEQDIGKLIQDSINSLSRIGGDVCPSNIPSLDVIIKGGLRRADYVVLAARPGVGKSALCLDFLMSTALMGKWSLLFSTEMPKEQIMLRAIAKMSMIPMDKLTGTNGYQMDLEDSRRYTAAYNLLSKSKMVIYDDKISASSIIAEYHKQKAMGNDIRLVVVDYIQQLRPDGKYSSRAEAISEMSSQFRRLTVEENITVIVVAQLNREANPFECAQLSNIKDCGSIEQDVTTAIMLHIDKNDRQVTHANLLKHRNGENYKSTQLRFFGSCMAFRDLEGK